MIHFHFLLVDIDDVEVEFANLLAAILKPEDLQEVVDKEAILVSVALK